MPLFGIEVMAESENILGVQVFVFFTPEKPFRKRPWTSKIISRLQ